MTLDRLWQLDPTTAASNSNFAGANISENCAPSGINNALRALGVMVARDLAFQASAISSSVSTNIVTSSTGLYVPITGANAINSFGVVPNEQPSAAVFRILEFSSSASLSHGGSIFLSGGASRRTQPGDVMGVIHEGSGDQWRELFYSPADGRLHTDSLSVTTITNRSMSTSAISTVTLNAASASITTIGISALNSLNSISSSVGNFTLLNVSGQSVAGRKYIIADQKASGTNGGGLTSGAFRTRTLNTELLDQIGITTTASVMALPAGTYIADFVTTCYSVDNFMARLRDTTNNVDLVVGVNADAPAGNPGWSTGYGSFTLSGAANVELQVRVTTTNGTDGGGQAHSFGTEEYSVVRLEKIA